MIISKDNPAIKQLKRWLDAPKRADEIIVLEGIHLAQAYFASGLTAQKIWVADGALGNGEIQTLLQDKTYNVMSDPVFRSVSSLAQGASILCEVAKPVAVSSSVPAHAILLDGVQDAGNLGSILRSAAAAGVRDVYLNHACANPYAPKVLRAAVGAHFDLNIFDAADLLDVAPMLKQHGVQILATDLNATHEIYQADLTVPTAWLLGSEGSGVSDELLRMANQTVVIPMAAGESLNVAAAAAVCLFETLRQSRTSV